MKTYLQKFVSVPVVVPFVLLVATSAAAGDLTSDLQHALDDRFGSDYPGLNLSIDHKQIVTIAGHVEGKADEQRVISWLKARDGVGGVITLMTTD